MVTVVQFANLTGVFRQALEGKLLSGLQDQVMRPEAVEYVLDNFESAVLKALDDLGGELEQMRQRKAELEREVAKISPKLSLRATFRPHCGPLSLPVSARSAR